LKNPKTEAFLYKVVLDPKQHGVERFGREEENPMDEEIDLGMNKPASRCISEIKTN